VSVHLLQRAPRNNDMAALHLTFFVAAITTELCIRTQLYLTHYPQLGGHGLHIAHLLWGGLFMVVALAILLSLLGRRPRQVAALVGGIGFGFFIDELGKFITADNNYFYKPAAGIIYLIFIGLYLGSRAYQRHRGLNEAERVRNAIELIGEATRGPFKVEYRDQALALLAEVPASHPLRDPLIALAGEIDTRPNPNPPWYRRLADAAAAGYRRWTEHGWFHGLVFGVFAVWAVAGIVAVLGLVLSITFHDHAARAEFERDAFGHLNFLNVASLVSTGVSSLLVAFGLVRWARRQRLDAYAWFTRALLVSIFVTRVFTFVESQFGAVFGLAVDVLLLITVQLMAQQERRRLLS
jgi:ABC-type multidrug transport system fused ATPase/permease subunit